MDSHQKAKALRRLLDFTRNPEIEQMARELLCGKESSALEPPQKKAVSPFRDVSTHWIVGLIAGVGVSYQGAHEVLVRCIVLAILFVWLSVDGWLILANHPRRNAISALMALGLASVFSVSGYAIYINNQSAQKDAVLLGLSIGESDPSDTAKPFSAKFIIRNQSAIKIPTTKVRCLNNDALYPGNNKLFWNGMTFDAKLDFPLEPGGDGQTFVCPQDKLFAPDQPVCADITIDVEYALPFQKVGTTPEKKSIRLVTHQENNGFHWYPQNQSFPWGACTGIKLRKWK